MTASKKKFDDKNLKILRELVCTPTNKHCFDCNQRGPTYVNMTIGSFVCTGCSGILRGLNPPHRVKSVSMASFSQEEMDFLKSHGNELCRRVWLGLHDRNGVPEPDARNENAVRDFMTAKYEKKRYYVAPSEELLAEARQQNQAVFDRIEKGQSQRGQRSVLGLGPSTTSHIPGPPTTAVFAQPHNSVSAATATSTAKPKPAVPVSNNTDLFGGDFLAGPSANTTKSNAFSSDLDFFGSSAAPSAAAPVSTSQTSQNFGTVDFFASSNATSSTTAPTLTAQKPMPPAGPTSTSVKSNSDKYAALAELDGLFSSGTSSSGATSIFDSGNNASDWNNAPHSSSKPTSSAFGGHSDWTSSHQGHQAPAHSEWGSTKAPPASSFHSDWTGQAPASSAVHSEWGGSHAQPQATSANVGWGQASSSASWAPSWNAPSAVSAGGGWAPAPAQAVTATSSSMTSSLSWSGGWDAQPSSSAAPSWSQPPTSAPPNMFTPASGAHTQLQANNNPFNPFASAATSNGWDSRGSSNPFALAPGPSHPQPSTAAGRNPFL